MARVLEMRFNNAAGRLVTIKVPDVLDSYSGADASLLMDNILARNIFTSNGGDLITKDSARIVVTDVIELELS
ncbi:MAG: DUF2922 domain-containing protein [Syntrophomonadaceae bacterium]|jgi:hypothetical protein|nr:DUF2922 domain-containing protein [Syntrophomonadaceae bacterium]